jgi:hypothetical protein
MAFLLLCIFPSAPLCAQTTWYVDASGTPPGSGSAADPFTAIQSAAGAAASGDAILVLPGTYAETVDTLGKALTIEATHGPLATTIVAVPGSAATVTLDGGSCRLEGFTLERAAAAPDEAGVFVAWQTSSYVVRCIVRGHDVGIANQYDAYIEESTVTSNRVGVQGHFQSISSIRNSIVHGNAQVDLEDSLLILLYSNVGTSTGIVSGDSTGYFDADPRFWDAPGGDLRLRADSPCVDAGDPAAPFDPDGSVIDVGALAFDPVWAPGTERYCFGDDALCPCGNGGSGDGGCDVAQGTGGLELAVASFLPDGAGGGSASLVGAGYPPNGAPGVTLIRSTAAQTPPVVFGDGLRCIAAAGLVRVHASLAAGGASLSPVTHGAGAGTFFYQVWVRNQPAGYCTSAAFNLSNAVSIAW